MGGLLSRGGATSASAVRTIPVAAHKSDAMAKAAVAAAFPPSPSVPRPDAPLPTAEMEANRQIMETLAKTQVLTRTTPTGGSSTSPEAIAAANSDGDQTGVSIDDLMAALMLHGENPQEWTAPSLAQKYGIADANALADALAHVRVYRIVADEDGRPRGIGMGMELPKRSDAFNEFDAHEPAEIGRLPSRDN